MKKNIFLFFVSMFHPCFLHANSIQIINSTAGQPTITATTTAQTVSISAQPDQNKIFNDIQNPDSSSTQLTYDNNPLDKITIIRLSTSMPQIIYYNNEVSVDSSKNPSGLYDLNSSGKGTMQIWQDTISINNTQYQLLDISSIITRCNLLKSSMHPDNIETIQKQIQDLQNSIKLIEESDKAVQLGGQIAVTKTALMIVINEIEIIKTLHNMVQKIQDLQDHLSDDNTSETDNQLQGIAIGLRTIETANSLQSMQSGSKTLETGLDFLQSAAHGPVFNQIQRVKNAMNALQLAVQQKQNQQASVNPEELISPHQQSYDEATIYTMQNMNNTGMGY
jgi:hypothetical protein